VYKSNESGIADLWNDWVALDYASVVFVGFAVISAVWYLISTWALVLCVPVELRVLTRRSLLSCHIRRSFPLHGSTRAIDRIGSVHASHIQSRVNATYMGPQTLSGRILESALSLHYPLA
jgi:hypothetical protein